jgi:hypothetical protein
VFLGCFSHVFHFYFIQHNIFAMSKFEATWRLLLEDWILSRLTVHLLCRFRQCSIFTIQVLCKGVRDQSQ